MEKNYSSIPGTKPSAQSSQLLISTGIAALDNLLGGGLPIGTIALIEEDLHGIYSKIILKYFLAEGIVNKHSIFLASQDTCPTRMVKELPAVIENDIDIKEKNSNQHFNDRMKIAFRYQNLPTHEKESLNFSHHYDLSKTMPPDDIENSDIQCWNGQNIEIAKSTYKNPTYNALLKSIKVKMREGKHLLKDSCVNVRGGGKKTVLRIAVHSLGSPQWIPDRTGAHGYFLHAGTDYRDLDKFIFCLRALVRSAHAVAVVTVPSHLYNTNSLQRCIHSSDIAMRLQSFSGTELEFNPSLSDYHGFFQLTKLAAINSLTSKHPGAVDYAFKLRRRKFTIEVLHLPPDVQDSTENKKSNGPSLGCATNSRSLDF